MGDRGSITDRCVESATIQSHDLEIIENSVTRFNSNLAISNKFHSIKKPYTDLELSKEKKQRFNRSRTQSRISSPTNLFSAFYKLKQESAYQSLKLVKPKEEQSEKEEKTISLKNVIFNLKSLQTNLLKKIVS